MKTTDSTTAKGKTQKKESKLWALVVPAMLVTILAGTVFLINYNRNYAAEVAAPIEQELVKAGAVKRCENSVNGKELLGTVDTQSYGSMFITSLNAEEAKQLIHKVFSASGFSLKPEYTSTHAIDSFRDDSKQSQFSDLKPGTIRAGASIYKDSAQRVGCMESGDLPHGEGNVVITTGFNLPEVKFTIW